MKRYTLGDYQIRRVNEENPVMPGEKLQAISGVNRAIRWAIEWSRSERQPVMVWLAGHARAGLRGELSVGYRGWVRFYSPGAPKVTLRRWQTIQELARFEDIIKQSKDAMIVAGLINANAEIASDVGLVDVSDRLRSFAKELVPLVEERARAEAVAISGLTNRPRRRHEVLEEPPAIMRASTAA